MSDINPALTPDQWKGQDAPYRLPYPAFRNDDAIVHASSGDLWVDGFGETSSALFYGKHRHALAAIALHGQSFGFNRDDVDRLRKRADLDEEVAALNGAAGWVSPFRSLADRIAALLPPRETP